MHYIVVGADEANGQKCTLTIEAEDETSAAEIARSKGVFPTRIDPLLAQRTRVQKQRQDLAVGGITMAVAACLVFLIIFLGLQPKAPLTYQQQLEIYQRNHDVPTYSSVGSKTADDYRLDFERKIWDGAAKMPGGVWNEPDNSIWGGSKPETRTWEQSHTRDGKYVPVR